MPKLNIALLFAASVIFTGCSHKYNFASYSKLDLSATGKTVTVPAQGSHLNVAVKEVLGQEGWAMRIAIPGKTPETKYMMTTRSGPASFNISFIDVEQGMEAFQYWGKGELRNIKWDLHHILNNRDPQKQPDYRKQRRNKKNKRLSKRNGSGASYF